MNKMNIAMIVYLMVLFVVLTPGQFLTLPSATSPKLHVAVVHAAVFGLIWHFTHKTVEKSSEQLDL